MLIAMFKRPGGIFAIIAFLFLVSPSYAAVPAGSMTAIVKHAVEKNKLLSNPHCVDYQQIESEGSGLTQVDVMEKHGGECPGDLQFPISAISGLALTMTATSC